jgi:putative lipase involved disintegration of autophagic bodies
MAVRTWYPSSSTVWLTGHSLGGALASLVGLTHDLPAITFESPGEFQYANRIGLIPELPPSAPGSSVPDYKGFLETLPIYHIG